MARQIAKQAPLNSLITQEFSPGESVGEESDADILDWARKLPPLFIIPQAPAKWGKMIWL